MQIWSRKRFCDRGYGTAEPWDICVPRYRDLSKHSGVSIDSPLSRIQKSGKAAIPPPNPSLGLCSLDEVLCPSQAWGRHGNGIAPHVGVVGLTMFKNKCILVENFAEGSLGFMLLGSWLHSFPQNIFCELKFLSQMNVRCDLKSLFAF